MPTNAPPAAVSTTELNLVPKEVYGPKGKPTILRIGNGGAGSTGVIGALARDYLTDRGLENATIAWIQNISPLTLRALGMNAIDVALTYERDQEEEAVAAGLILEPRLAFHDHFVLVGPKTNPAAVKMSDTAAEAMAKIARFAVAAPSVGLFFSRDDRSATNVKEIELWSLAGVKPFAAPRPAWYIAENVFPQDAVRLADKLRLYTVTDHATFYSTRAELANCDILLAGGDVLRNTCNALLAAKPSPAARDFVAYVQSPRGQEIIKHFGKDLYGACLFSPADQPDFPVPPA